MLNIETEITIDCPAEKVWQVLADFAAYPKWNTFFQEISGDLTEGEAISIVFVSPGMKPMAFKPKLLKAAINDEIRWRGNILADFVFVGEHYLKIEPISDNQVRFVHGENFSGLLLPFLKSSLSTKTKKGFENFNSELKKQVENRV